MDLWLNSFQQRKFSLHWILSSIKERSKKLQILHKHFYKIDGREHSLNPFMRPAFPDAEARYYRDITRKKQQRLLFLININAKILPQDTVKLNSIIY